MMESEEVGKQATNNASKCDSENHGEDEPFGHAVCPGQQTWQLKKDVC